MEGKIIIMESIIKKDKIENYYTLDDKNLGEGGFGVVKKAFSKKDNQPFAVKIYKRKEMEPEDEAAL